ncbi:MAG: DAK2 domain-containing protein [Candidatus Dojkabacteria bacterium]|nr:DAK2 domain-containing protein [Candidatus Dojkabacteria bacterium]
MITEIDAEKLKQIFQYAEKLLLSKEELLNNLNVYPVPDGDTGTNMSMTLNEVMKEIGEDKNVTISNLAMKISKASLMGARGNSGVILSQFIGGFCEKIETNLDKNQLYEAFQNGQKEAYNSVSEPVEGTILTIIKSATDEIGRKQSYNSLEKIMKAALVKAQNTLRQTPEMLHKLKEAGVVDAGGAGFVYFLEAFYQALEGRKLITSTSSDDFTSPKLARVWDDTVGTFGSGGARSIIEFNFKVLKYTFSKVKWLFKQAFHILKRGKNFLSVRKAFHLMRTLGTQLKWQNIKKANLSIFSLLQVWQKPPKERYCYEAILSDVVMSADNIKTKLSAFGSSLIVAQKDQYTKIHFHLKEKQNIEKVLATIGRIEKIKVDDIHKQQREFINRKIQAEPQTSNSAVIAVVNSHEFKEMYESFEGVYTIPGGNTMNPSISDISQKIDFTQSQNIILLPNNKNIFIGAKKAAEKSIKQVSVVETFDQVQGLSAILNFDKNESLEKNLDMIENGLTLVKTFSISKAIKDSTIDGVTIKKGNYFSVDKNKVISSAENVHEVLTNSIQLLYNNEELMTIYAGKKVNISHYKALFESIEKEHEIEVQAQKGGQPNYQFIVSLE